MRVTNGGKEKQHEIDDASKNKIRTEEEGKEKQNKIYYQMIK